MFGRTLLPPLLDALSRFPVVALLGPRQAGKTTLAREVAARRGNADYLDLERPSDRARMTDPELFLGSRTDRLVILDEVQQLDGLFPLLRSLVDDHRVPGRFLLLGSASPERVNRSSESLAGRIRYLELHPLSLAEIGAHDDPSRASALWLRGGFPNSYLAPDDEASFEWRESFVRTFLERDLAALGSRVPSHTMRRFFQMLAHWNGQLWNASTIARSLDSSPQAANRHLDLLCDAFVMRRLPPFLSNTGKRLVKSPRAYFRDTGLLHALLQLGTFDELMGHPALGASFEGFVIEQVLSALDPVDYGFYRTAAGAEIDLVLTLRGHAKPIAIEVKHSATPKPSRGFWTAREDLGIEQAFVIHPGKNDYPLDRGVTAWPVSRIAALPV